MDSLLIVAHTDWAKCKELVGILLAVIARCCLLELKVIALCHLRKWLDSDEKLCLEVGIGEQWE